MQGFQAAVEARGLRLTFIVVPDARLRRNAHWTLRGDVVRLRVPPNMKRAEAEAMLPKIAQRIARQRQRAQKQQDLDLTARAEAINARYFGGELVWHTIRWAENMSKRLGSFTTGGSTDGDIRISTKIRGWPDYVVDYVIAHEMCHRKHPDHSPAFWAYLARYPYCERARGFIEGAGYQED
ncbi:MAG: M48 family metallopeptidase [Anaerolineae bacterium]|nr:M48 family metallopeptidase [Anaerolineae bacterium]